MNRTLPLLISLILIFTQAQKLEAQQPPDLPSASGGVSPAGNQYSVSSTDSLIGILIDQTNLDTLKHFVNILSGEDSVTINESTYLLLSRNVLHPHNDLAADYIFQTLSRFGLPCYNQNYSSSGRNVYAIQSGSDFPDQEFIICAHYDDMPAQPPAPGADDNASGVAAVLEAARILSRIPTPYTIIYALWDEEEIGLIGSAHYAGQAYQSGEDILGVVNLDMLGWDSNNDGVIDIHTRPYANSLQLAELISYLENDYNLGLSPIIYNPGARNSDHGSFWNQGYTAVVLSEAYYGGDFNAFYHSSNDRIINFNLDYFHTLSKLAVATIAHLAFDSIITNVETREGVSLSGFVLRQNYPNPFNPSTTIEIDLPHAELVTLKIYNVLGGEVTTLVAERLPAGRYKYEWDAKGLASGMYFYRLDAGNFLQTKKMLLIR